MIEVGARVIVLKYGTRPVENLMGVVQGVENFAPPIYAVCLDWVPKDLINRVDNDNTLYLFENEMREVSDQPISLEDLL